MKATEFFTIHARETNNIIELMEAYAEHRLETQQLWGVLDSDERIVSVHRTDEGAKKNLKAFDSEPEWNVDIITIHP